MTIFDIFDKIKNYDYANLLFWWKIFAAAISIFFVVVTAYAVKRTQEVFAIVRGNQKTAPISPVAATKTAPSKKNIDLWQKVRTRISSDDENERKLAIVSADSLIDKILELAGYQGANLGERLKNINSSELESLQDMWEAHKVRNRIAHEPHLALSKQEAARTLAHYEKVLKELRYL